MFGKNHLKIKPYRALLWAALVVAALTAAPVLAQPGPPDGPWAFTVEGGAAWQSDVDLDDDNGQFSVDRWFASAGVDYLWNFRTALGVSLGGGETRYDFSDISGISEGDPWEDIEDLRLSVVSRFAINDRVSGLIIPSLRQNRERGASSSDSQTFGLLAGVSWKLSDSLTIGPGIGVFERLEESTRVFPILVIDWDFSERWNLSTGRGLAASQGPGLTLSYDLAEAWTLGIAGRYEEIDFRLNDRGPAPGGVGRDTVFPLVFSADWQPNPDTSLSLFAGAEFGGSLALDDAEGNTITENDYDTALVFGGSFRFRF